MARKKTSEKEPNKLYSSYVEKLESQVQSNQSKLSMILGALIVLVVGFLVFNYFNKDGADLGPAQNTQQEEVVKGDVSPDKLPGRYTVKEGDTLFLIAEKYYQDGNKFEDLAKANNLTDVNSIVLGQDLEIPKLEDMATPAPQVEATPAPAETATGGPIVDWGPAISGDTYTVAEGDWLSTIAARAYNGDVLSYQKLAQANNISNPNLIYPGQVLSIPR